MKKILFVTGTGTGVGKTVLTAMLLAFLREGGAGVLAMKPFCSGSRGDARLLLSLQKGCLTLEEVNPFYFDKPLAPAVGAGRGRGGVTRRSALEKIRRLGSRCDLLLVEGAGGLLAPLGAGYTLRDLIADLDAETIVVSANRLGVINHVLLTAEALQNAGIKEFKVVLMGVKRPDLSARGNAGMIRQMLPQTPIFCVPFLGIRASGAGAVKINAKNLKKTLAELVKDAMVGTFFHRKKRFV